MNKILVAVHGYEPHGWVHDVVRAIPSPEASTIRVLTVLDVPSPPFTSLIPAARRRYRGALAEWRRLAEARTQPSLEALRARLGRPPEIVTAPAREGDPGRAIVEHARAWGADVIIVGRDTRSRMARLPLPAAHERVVSDAPCAVLVTPADRYAPPATVELGRPDLGRRSPAAMPGGA
jgi:nucleotide-binding universal stress UspA family protein